MFKGGCLVDRLKNQDPDIAAVITDEIIYTYKEIDEKIYQTAQILEKAGIKRGDRVGFLGKNKLETLCIMFALARLEATSCPISTRMPQEQKQDYLEKIGAVFYIDVDTCSITNITDRSTVFADTTPLFSLLASSGSTAEPKVVAHSYENFYYSALGSNLALGLSRSHRWLMSLPLYHVGGIAIAFRCFLAGATLVFSERSLLESLRFYKVSHVSLVPTQLYRLLQEPGLASLDQLEAALIGGASLSEELFHLARARGIKIFFTYGMTEMSSQITMDQYQPTGSQLTAGLALPYRQMKIEQDGQIYVKGPTLFQGYWTKENTLSLPLQDGWFATGDMGSLNPQGNLLVIGRKDNMFISGGENIHPEMIEYHLNSLPGIIQSFIIPRQDQEFGQRPVAFVQQEDSRYTLEEIRDRLEGKVPRFCLPIEVRPLPNLFTIDTKVSRSKLKQYLIDSSSTDIN
jgi:O-succinylbenzoic acid--CoA ligase